MNKSIRRNNVNGFTLTELLVTIVVTGIVLGMTSLLFISILNNSKNTTNDRNRSREIIDTFKLIDGFINEINIDGIDCSYSNNSFSASEGNIQLSYINNTISRKTANSIEFETIDHEYITQVTFELSGQLMIASITDDLGNISERIYRIVGTAS